MRLSIGSNSVVIRRPRVRPFFCGAAILSMALLAGCDVYVDDDDRPHVDVHESPDVRIDPPDVDVHEAPDVDINEAPDIDVNEAPDVDVDVDGPGFNPPDVDVDTPDVDVDVDSQTTVEPNSDPAPQPQPQANTGADLAETGN
jgi:hypothetical protein